MKLDGSCHCGAVKFCVASHTPYPFMRCYCSICRKTAGGGGYAINIMGDAADAAVRGAKNVSVYRARIARKSQRAGDAVDRAAPFLLQMRQRAVGVRSAMAAMGLSVRLGDRHAAAEAAGGSRIDAGLRGAVGRCSPAARRTPHFAGYPKESIADWHAKRGLDVA